MTTRQDYIAAMNSMVAGEIPLTEADQLLAISMGVKEHSRHRPHPAVEDFDGDGGFDYPLVGFCELGGGLLDHQIRGVPGGTMTTKRPPCSQTDQWAVYEKPAGKVLRFLNATPESTESLRVKYTALHTCTDSACTVDDFDTEAVQALCASHFCMMLSAYYAQSVDSTIAADSVQHSGRSREYAAPGQDVPQVLFRPPGDQRGANPGGQRDIRPG